MITVYSKDKCVACDSAKSLLSSLGIEHEVINTSDNFEAFNFIVSEGARSFPQIYKDGKLFANSYQTLMEIHKSGNLK